MTVGVRELKTNLSRYLEQVQRGARIRVTAHGRTIATLQPPDQAAPALSWARRCRRSAPRATTDWRFCS